MAETFWTVELPRADLVRLLRSEDVGAAERVKGAPAAPAPGKVVAVWTSAPERRETPVAILVPERSERDFFAWVWSYVGELRPLTAYCHVLDGSALRQLLSRDMAVWAKDFAVPLAGLLLGECAKHALAE